MARLTARLPLPLTTTAPGVFTLLEMTPELLAALDAYLLAYISHCLITIHQREH